MLKRRLLNSELCSDLVERELDNLEYKRISYDSNAIVRTGEFTPYANIFLLLGADFTQIIKS